MRKLAIAALALTLAASIVSAFAQQSDDYITVKKSSLPPDVLKKIYAAENPKPTAPSTHHWFFLMSGATGSGGYNVLAVAGPFKDQADCNEINAWARRQPVIVSRCWYEGD